MTSTDAAAGAINGFVSSCWGVPSFMVTPGMLNVARGLALQVTNARAIYDFPDGFIAFGTLSLGGLPAIFLLALALLAVRWVVLTRPVFGRMVYAIAAVIIGGTSLSGGRGSLAGTLLGAVVIGVLGDGLILIGVTDFIRQIVTGLVIILAVVLDSYRARLSRALG